MPQAFNPRKKTLLLGKQTHRLEIHTQIRGELMCKTTSSYYEGMCHVIPFSPTYFCRKQHTWYFQKNKDVKLQHSFLIINVDHNLHKGESCHNWWSFLCQVSSTRADPFRIFLWPSKTVKFSKVSLADRTVLKPSPKSWLSDHKMSSSFIPCW